MPQTHENKNEKGVMSTSSSILIGSLIISFSILLNGGIIKIKGLNTNKAAGTTGTPVVQASSVPAPAAPAAPDDNTPVKVELADAPVLGNKNAPVTLVEFSDYECPFCKRYFTDTYGEIKKNYIDTGKVKVVFRNLPLSFHQNAHKQAQAALCARDQGGDDVYFKYHDEMFKRTTSGGTGLALDQLSVLAKDLGLDGSKLQTCLDSDKYKEKVDKDLAYANTVGATGTPTFFVGQSDDSGTVTATRIVGAQPYSAFQGKIDPLLK